MGGWVGWGGGEGEGGGKGKEAAMHRARACMLCVSLALSSRPHRNRTMYGIAGQGFGRECDATSSHQHNIIQTFSLSEPIY